MENSLDLEKRIEEELDSARFNFLEATGFQAKPRLALMAGAAIGYRLGVKEALESLGKKAKK